MTAKEIEPNRYAAIIKTMVNIGNALELVRCGFYAERHLATNQQKLMDIIFLRELKVTTLIGIYEREKLVPQTLQIDLDIALPNSRACTSDDFNAPWVKVSVAKLQAIRNCKMVGISIERGQVK